MKIEEILRDKGRDVVTITESRSVLDAARILVEHNTWWSRGDGR